MDGLDTLDTTFEWSQEWGISSSSEAIREKSEKQKESYSKALAGISRSRSDEKKSQSQDDLLAEIVGIVIQDGNFNEIISILEELSNKNFPAFIISAVISLASPGAIRCILAKYRLVDWFPVLRSRIVPLQFQQDILTQDEKTYINAWVELLFILIKTTPSGVSLRKLHTLLKENEKILVHTISTSFTIFLSKLSISWSKEIQIYSQFIVSQIQKTLVTIVFEDIDTGKLIHL